VGGALRREARYAALLGKEMELSCMNVNWVGHEMVGEGTHTGYPANVLIESDSSA